MLGHLDVHRHHGLRPLGHGQLRGCQYQHDHHLDDHDYSGTHDHDLLDHHHDSPDDDDQHIHDHHIEQHEHINDHDDHEAADHDDYDAPPRVRRFPLR